MITTNKKRGRPKSVNGATNSIRIRVTPEFKAKVLAIRTKLVASEAELIIRAINELERQLVKESDSAKNH